MTSQNPEAIAPEPDQKSKAKPKTKPDKYLTHNQANAYASPWSMRDRVVLLLWHTCWTVFCSWTPKPLNPWRLIWLRLFGAQINGNPFVHQRARIQIPWHLILHDRASLGDRTNAYALGIIELKAKATVAQEVYLCTGTHDFADPDIPLMTAKITIGSDAFIGARAFIMPGVTIGDRAVIGACAVVTKDMPAHKICTGHPCRVLRDRPNSRQLDSNTKKVTAIEPES
ncbi:hexapeptide repeat-containing transferase [Thalassoporum mexicanum PCC 7367]|uniref:DapH/DapD/GlmU-related protein n=1 Tax=Thalassoporum mexicanum TaxID=3457544 RepID=UPI00029FEBA7|nr:DapH/DapD/GlmU-related protein [Pseudanabaena sp. PCC 7367]AFY69120.1 hexapeptide repeat-containing transferase [Pseudanabaena sp. PCC 7367]